MKFVTIGAVSIMRVKKCLCVVDGPQAEYARLLLARKAVVRGKEYMVLSPSMAANLAKTCSKTALDKIDLALSKLELKNGITPLNR